MVAISGHDLQQATKKKAESFLTRIAVMVRFGDNKDRVRGTKDLGRDLVKEAAISELKDGIKHVILDDSETFQLVTPLS
ncbi:unnamed protein product [Linum trigynum]|uniref:Uncharacterized protein n=1 Tax=Linum trigynum TaxID=586398 RepID=A0AAV2D7S1_9ROSI